MGAVGQEAGQQGGQGGGPRDTGQLGCWADGAARRARETGRQRRSRGDEDSGNIRKEDEWGRGVRRRDKALRGITSRDVRFGGPQGGPPTGTEARPHEQTHVLVC